MIAIKQNSWSRKGRQLLISLARRERELESRLVSSSIVYVLDESARTKVQRFLAQLDWCACAIKRSCDIDNEAEARGMRGLISTETIAGKSFDWQTLVIELNSHQLLLQLVKAMVKVKDRAGSSQKRAKILDVAKMSSIICIDHIDYVNNFACND